MRKQKHRTFNTGSEYKGITVHAAPGIHEAVFLAISEFVGHGKVLEIGTGSGAFSARLAHAGYNVTSSDISIEGFQAATEFIPLDLNTDFSECFTGDDRFDAVVAIETIEHLENPLHFLRQLRKVLQKNGYAFITFPSIYIYSAVMAYFWRGTFVNWDERQYWDGGHQTLLTDWLFEQHCEKTGFHICKKDFIAPIDFSRQYPSMLKRIAVSAYTHILKLFSTNIPPQARTADSIMFVLKNSGV